MSGYVMCYVAHEASPRFDWFKVLHSAAGQFGFMHVYATSIYFHVFWQARCPYIVFVGMPIKGYYGLKCGIHPGLSAQCPWPFYVALMLDPMQDWQGLSGPVGTYINTLKPPTFGGWVPILAGPLSRCPVSRCPVAVARFALESCICGRIDASRASILAASMWNFSDRFAGNDGQTWSTMKKCGKTAILKRVKNNSV